MAMTMHKATQDGGIHLGTTHLHLKHILFATDFSSQAGAAFKVAVQLCRHFGSKLYTVHILTPALYAAGSGGVIVPAIREVELRRAQEKAVHYFARMSESDSIEHEEIITYGFVNELIGEIVESRGIDLVVMGSHGRGGLSKLALGSVAESALRHLH